MNNTQKLLALMEKTAKKFLDDNGYGGSGVTEWTGELTEVSGKPKILSFKMTIASSKSAKKGKGKKRK